MNRYTNNIQQVYIADGFVDDCEELVHRCVQMQTLTYRAFCDIWKDMNFALVFQGRTSGAEIAELSEELLQIAKQFLVANTSNFEESVAGLFLVYSLLNLQPYPGFAALRLVPEDVRIITRIEEVARRERRYDILYILGSVLMRGPCQFHAAQRERGMEFSIRKYLEGFPTIGKNGVRPKGVFYRQNKELDILKELNDLSQRYAKAKQLVYGKLPDRNLTYSNANFAKQMNISLKRIISGITDDDEEEENEGLEHYNTVQAIKDRAVKNKVNPMRHLTGVDERIFEFTSPKDKPEIKSKAGKVKRGSPTKPLVTGSPKKRNAPQKAGKKRIKRKSTDCSMKNDQSIIQSEQHDTEIGEDWNIEDFGKGVGEINNAEVVNEERSGLNMTLQDLNIEVGRLPVSIRTGEECPYVQIELIDEYDPKGEQNVTEQGNDLISNEPDDLSINKDPKINTSDEPSSSKDTFNKVTRSTKISRIYRDVFKKPSPVKKLKWPQRRELKKTILKSKFKKMGILPIANFKDTK